MCCTVRTLNNKTRKKKYTGKIFKSYGGTDTFIRITNLDCNQKHCFHGLPFPLLFRVDSLTWLTFLIAVA
jgi:hypothetical protein